MKLIVQVAWVTENLLTGIKTTFSLTTGWPWIPMTHSRPRPMMKFILCLVRLSVCLSPKINLKTVIYNCFSATWIPCFVIHTDTRLYLLEFWWRLWPSQNQRSTLPRSVAKVYRDPDSSSTVRIVQSRSDLDIRLGLHVSSFPLVIFENSTSQFFLAFQAFFLDILFPLLVSQHISNVVYTFIQLPLTHLPVPFQLPVYILIKSSLSDRRNLWLIY